MPEGVVIALGVFAVMVLVAVIAGVVSAVATVTGIESRRKRRR